MRRITDDYGKDILIVPGYDISGNLQSIERIPAAPGEIKKHLGPKTGSFCGIRHEGKVTPREKWEDKRDPTDPGRQFYVGLAEGLATSWAVDKMRHLYGPVYECFGQMLFPKAIEELRRVYGEKAQMVVYPDAGADEKKLEECKALGAIIVRIPGDEAKGTDWHDVFVKHGRDAGARMLRIATEEAMREAEEAEEAAEEQEDFYFIPEDELQLTAPKWLVHGLLPAGALVEVFGAPGSGKTFWLIGALSSIAAGVPFAEHTTQQKPTLYFCGEGSRDIKRRIAAWKKSNNINRPIPLHVSNKPGDFCNPQFFEKIRKAVLKFRDKHGTPGAIGIDTLSRNVSADINDNAAMAEFIRNIEDLKRELGGDTLISWAHHSPHTAPERSLGAIALKGAVDVSYSVESKGESSVHVCCRKMKDAEEPKPHIFEKEVVHLEELLPEEESGELTSLYLRLQRVGLNPEERSKNKDALKGHQRTAYEALHSAVKEEGAFSESGEFRGVHLEVWRPYFKRRCTAETQQAQKKAFQEARGALVDKGILSVEDNVYSFVLPSDCIRATSAIKERLKLEEPEQDKTPSRGADSPRLDYNPNPGELAFDFSTLEELEKEGA